ncbi:dihydroxyacetone kinase family protein [Selenomonas sp. TAMA-11512]|uniref:dihydroxyacetone kinase subunit DhaL n=1 Tax=Selenomonas sp. TAMA-11512 TaxID=3095337 RepID=UPI00308B4D3C|nr:dihydroxyacetone kinase family protein [Selenomonas sp. TAMA-11512]
MRKIINAKEDVVSEMLEGFVGAYSRFYRKHPEVNGVILKSHRKGKVAVVVGGGSGHEPLFAGFLGAGLGDAAACGNIFASPDPQTVALTAKAVESGKGVLFIYGNYAGDNLNFDMGEEFLAEEGIRSAHVRVMDDVVSAPKERRTDRRGIAGDVFVVKIAGAAADTGAPLESVLKITEKARDNTFSVGVATAPAQLPNADEPVFTLPEGEIEYGMGLHGEKGVERTTWQTADALAERMYGDLKAEAGLKEGDTVCVLVNSLGSTTILELSIVYRKVRELLRADGIGIHDVDLNGYCTSQEMGGFSITFLKLDEELKTYYDMPCYSPYYAKGSVEGASAGVEEDDDKMGTSSAVSKDKEPIIITRSRAGVLNALSAADAKNMLLYIAQKIIKAKPYLTEIDSAIGDGDHGIGMAGGMQKVLAQLPDMESANAYSYFETAGKAMLLSMGGASGVIFGSLYLAGAKGMEPKETLDAADLARMERKSLAAIQERGNAKVGDKTMVDALEPAVIAMERTAGEGLLPMLRAAEEAAKEGVENTKKYTAKFGRAKSLMERAVGYQDAGATSTYLIFRGMREFVEDLMEKNV